MSSTKQLALCETHLERSGWYPTSSNRSSSPMKNAQDLLTLEKPDVYYHLHAITAKGCTGAQARARPT